MSDLTQEQKTHEEILEERLRKIGVSENEIKEAKASWQATKMLLPRNFDQIAESERCLFCVKEKREASSFANMMLAHQEPETYKSTILSFGKKKTKSSIGSLISVNIPICKRCKRTYQMITGIKWLSLIVGAGIGYGIGEVLDSIGLLGNEPGFIITTSVLLLAGIGYFVGKLISGKYAEKKATDVHLDIFDIEILAEMKKAGWFILQDSSTSSALVYKKNPEAFGRVFS